MRVVSRMVLLKFQRCGKTSSSSSNLCGNVFCLQRTEIRRSAERTGRWVAVQRSSTHTVAAYLFLSALLRAARNGFERWRKISRFLLSTADLLHIPAYITYLCKMKFQSVVVGTALVLATMDSGSAFVPSSAVQMRQTFAAKNPALNMVATEPEVIVNGEAKPRRTREVRKLFV